MRVISRSRLREFWSAKTSDRRLAESSMSAWFKTTEMANWKDWGELKQTFGSADRVGNCVVFDVANNHYRVIGRIFFNAGRLYILAVMDHAEYDQKDGHGQARWISRCGCRTPPPKP